MNERRFVRRNRVDEPIAIGIAVVGGLLAATSGARPTGSVGIDVVLIVLSSAAVVWASASSQWWASAAAAGVGAIVAFQPIVAAVGALGFLAGLNVGTWRRDQSVMRAVIGVIAVNTLIRSDLHGFFGLSAIVGISVAGALFVLGLLRRPSKIRRLGWMSLAGVGALALLAGLSVGTAAVGARPNVSSGVRTARQAVDALNAGDYERSAELFEQASLVFDLADSRLGGALAAPGRILPGVAQNLTAGADLSAAAAQATSEASFALRQVDPAELTISGGSIDLTAIRAVEAPLLRVQVAFENLREVFDDAASPWLIGSVQDEMDLLDAEFEKNEPRLQNAIDAVRLAPQMLGEGSARRYLVLFTSPAEARGVGGFVGSFAVVEVDDGRLEVANFGRTAELSTPSSGTDCSECPFELLQRYGRFGFTTGPEGTVGEVLWSNITMPAHFPYIAEAASVVYPQAFGEDIDGVIVLDPYVVQTLMTYSGPIPVPELDVTVRPRDAAQFILEDQYVLAEDRGVRIEALNSLGNGAIAAILSGALPEPPTIARDLGPLIEERRLLMWTEDAEEQALLDDVGLLGSIPHLSGSSGGFSVSVSNAGASKIDVFLDVLTDVEIQPAGEGVLMVADVTMRNEAPGSGLPAEVIGNRIDLPDGSSRLFVTFYGSPFLLSSTLDGELYPVEPLAEAGWMAYSGYVDLGPGQERRFQLTFDIPQRSVLDLEEIEPTLWTQPLARRT